MADRRPVVRSGKRVSQALTLALALAVVAVTSGCAVVTVAGAAVGVAGAAAGAAVSAGGAVVSGTVKVAGKAVEKTVDLVTPGSPAPAKPPAK